MSNGNEKLPDISICIPTRNRAQLLSRCLSHLLTFSSINYEIIVGDNASTDDTRGVVSAKAKEFGHLSYLRHETDVGPSRNVLSILGRARGRYAYVLSDDDLVFENGLALLKMALDANPELAAAGGSHRSTDFLPDIATNFNYGPTRSFRIARGNHLLLAENFLVCDGYPLIRLDILRRYCGYQPRGFGLIPLFSQLLAHGDLLFLDQPIFQHFQNRESLSTKLPESWFHDFCDADIEIAFANLPTPLPAGTLEQIRQHFHRITYFQSARMCRIQQDYLLMWHFLLRAKAVGGVTEACLVECERMFLVEVLLQNLQQQIRDSATGKIRVEKTPLLLLLKQRLQEMLPEISISTDDTEATSDEGAICIVENPASGISTSPNTIVLDDVLASIRLTQRQIQLTAEANAIKIAVFSPQEPAPDFQGLMSNYGLPESHIAAESPAVRPAADPDMGLEARQKRPIQPSSGIGRNDLCPCGSKKKYKLCHGRRT